MKKVNLTNAEHLQMIKLLTSKFKRNEYEIQERKEQKRNGHIYSFISFGSKQDELNRLDNLKRLKNLERSNILYTSILKKIN